MRLTPEELKTIMARNNDLKVEDPDRLGKSAPGAMKMIMRATQNKYHAVRTYSELCGRTFDSNAEARRGEELALLQKAGQISSLEYQIKRVLSIKPRVTITMDFVYIGFDGVRVYEDVKGVMTRDFRTKLAWMEQRYNIHVNIIR